MAIPVMVVHGSHAGPVLCIVAGTHACEYPAIEAAIRLYGEADEHTLKGTLLIIPVLNQAAFWTTTPYLNPQDGLDISALYTVEGRSISYLIAHSVKESVLSKSDYIVDLHGGDLMEDIVPHTAYWQIGDKKIDEASESIARVYGTEFVYEKKGVDVKQSVGKPRIIAEAGGAGRLDEESTSVHLVGLTNIMKKLGMVEGQPVLHNRQILLHGRYEVFTQNAGIFYPKVKVGDRVKKGMVLGEIRNLQRHVVEQLLALDDGVVQLIMFNPVKLPQDLVFKVWMY
jgi:hypothetical protein